MPKSQARISRLLGETRNVALEALAATVSNQAATDEVRRFSIGLDARVRTLEDAVQASGGEAAQNDEGRDDGSEGCSYSARRPCQKDRMM